MGSTRGRKEALQQGMKALAFQEPWATFIVTGVKVHEYRSRRIKTPVRDLVVCASKTARVYEPVPGLCYGKAIGLVDVTSCEPDGEGGWVWGLENPRLVKPFDVHASASFFYVHDKVEVVPSGEWSYRNNVLPEALEGEPEEIEDVMEACFRSRMMLFQVFGYDVEEWL